MSALHEKRPTPLDELALQQACEQRKRLLAHKWMWILHARSDGAKVRVHQQSVLHRNAHVSSEWPFYLMLLAAVTVSFQTIPRSVASGTIAHRCRCTKERAQATKPSEHACMHMSQSASKMLLRTAGELLRVSCCTINGAVSLHRASSTSEILPSAAQACACSAAGTASCG